MLHRARGDPEALAADPSVWQHVDMVLEAIAAMSPCELDGTYHERLVATVARALGVRTAFVAELLRDDDGATVKVLALWSDGELQPTFEYPLRDTPCEQVLRTGMLRVESGVSALFPEDVVLARAGAESYLGVALLAADRAPMGHLAVLDDRPMDDAVSSTAIVSVFADQAAAALDRSSVGRRLASAERHFQLLFEQSPDPIILFDLDSWRPIEFNDRAATFMGYSREQFARLTITDLEMVPNPDETRAHVERIRELGEDVFEGFHRAKDGSPRHVVVNLRTTEWFGRQVMLTIWHDVTERKAAERAVRESENRLSSLLDSAMDAIVIVDAELRITRTNPSAERMFRRRGAELAGMPALHFLPGEEAREILTEVARSPRSGHRSQIWAPEGLQARRADGALFPVELTVSPFEVEGKQLYTLILRDVNDRRRTEAELKRLRQEKRALQEQLDQQSTPIIGDSLAMAGVLSSIDKVAATDSTVLLVGETGTGKELVARAIHDRSIRNERLLVPVNCAALPKDLIESELFGHEKGAFTGATRRKRGRFELADGGTLFLDEVGELAEDAQAKLLRVLQEGEIERVGGETTIRINVRLIAATHRDLRAMASSGGFRSDLYYRLSVFPLRIPPLRERLTDIPMLVEHFVAELAGRFGKRLHGFRDADMERLLAHSWPGNVRELQNIIERAAILTGDGWLRIDDGLKGLPGEPSSSELDDVVSHHLRSVLAACNWVVEGENGAAARLGLNPSTLRFRMKKLGIRRPPQNR